MNPLCLEKVLHYLPLGVISKNDLFDREGFSRDHLSFLFGTRSLRLDEGLAPSKVFEGFAED